MVDNSIFPIAIVIEIFSERKFCEIIYHADSESLQSILNLSNTAAKKTTQSFNNLSGDREYRYFQIVTLNCRDVMDLNKQFEIETDKMSDVAVINFISGNPANDITAGIIHFYKDEKCSLFNYERVSTRMLCMLSVPRSMAIRDILDFTASYKDYIDEMKVVKDSTPNEYIVLLKFSSIETTDSFYKNFSNIRFNSLESGICRLVYVSHVEFLSSSEVAKFPLTDLTELPTCSVCLERLDEPLNGILTIVCNHTFHSKCIQQMNESTCPVCRYSQTPQIMSDKYKCAVCDLREDLWLCLICAHIGCGRHENKHAEQHFTDTGHTFSMKMGTNVVWDYAADAHVHRLVANTSDGKLVEVMSSDDGNYKKLTNICMEYTALLADQLSTQKALLEGEFCQQLSVMEMELQQSLHVTEEAEERVRSMQRDKQQMDKRLAQTTQMMHRLQKELDEERLMNKSLMERQAGLTKDLKMKDDKIQSLSEQLSDLMLNLQFGARIAEAQSRGEVNEEELNEAEVSIGAVGSIGNRVNGRGRRQKRK